MKRFLIALIFIGCAHNIDIQKSLKESDIENRIIKEYQISKSALTKIDNEYIFFMPKEGGVGVYKLDSNFKLTKSILLKGLYDPHKLIAKDDKIYLLLYDEAKSQPLIITLDKNLNVIKKEYIGDKYDIPQDMIIDKAILLTTYKNGAKIKIITPNKTLLIGESPHNYLAKFIKEFNQGLLVVGSIQHPQEDLLIIFIKDNKVVWQKAYDFGLEDVAIDVKIEDKNAKIKVLSQDYMGAEEEFFITIDENGNIIKSKKGLKFDILPMKYRT